MNFDRHRHGYSLTVRAHDTTYTMEVITRKDGEVAVDQKRLATLATRTQLGSAGILGWRDQVAQVSISAAGPEGHTRRGLQTIGKRMVVVPQSALDELVAATQARRSREVNLDPIEFPATDVLLPEVLYGRLGRAGISIENPRETVGTGVCFGCERASSGQPPLRFGIQQSTL